MDDWVAFDVANLDQLARRLSDLATTLDRDLRQIRNCLRQGFGHGPSADRANSLIAEAHGNARDMLNRARIAHQVVDDEARARNPFAGLDVKGRKGWVRVDGSATSQSGMQAQSDVRTLDQAMAGKDRADSASRRRLLAIARNLRHHLGDKAYLSTFWGAAGPNAAKLAAFLHEQHAAGPPGRDPTKVPVLSAEDKNILNAFGTSLAAATRRKVFPQDNWGSITRPDSGDRWSANMLLRYGPTGNRWDPWFLAQWSRDTLDWRRQRISEGRPAFEVHGVDPSMYEEYEPTLALMERMGENRVASRLLLGDRHSGLPYTRQLVNPGWAGQFGAEGYDRGYDFSRYAGAVLKAAAYQHRGTDVYSELSTRAVANMIRATNELHPEANEGEPSILPPDLRHSLTGVAIAYIPDFAVSSAKDDGDHPNSELAKALREGSGKNDPWIVAATNGQLRAFLNEVLDDPVDLGRYKGAVQAHFSVATRVSLANRRAGEGHDYLAELASLRGMLRKVESDQSFSDAEKKDAEAEARQKFVDMFFGGFGNLPVNGSHVGATQAAVGFMQPLMDSAFDTSHAERAAEENKKAEMNLVFQMYIPVVQGLVEAGMIRAPMELPPTKDGKVVPGYGLYHWYRNNAMRKFAGITLEDWVNIAESGIQKQIH